MKYYLKIKIKLIILQSYPNYLMKIWIDLI